MKKPKVKKIVIEEIDGIMSMDVEGFNDIELIGIFSYYTDVIKVVKMQQQTKTKKDEKTQN